MAAWHSHSDTIAAIATPLGQGALGIIRVSGDKTREMVGHLFIKAGRPGPLKSHRFYYGHIIDAESKGQVDEVMLCLMLAPRSYTREDMAEIYTHGGLLVMKKVLNAVLKAGARLAQPGEFTKKAFLNGRLDLAQAEAVLEVIQAKSERALKWAQSQLSGQLSQKLKGMKESLMGLLAQIEAGLDFPEEELDLLPRQEMEKGLAEQAAILKRLLESFDQARPFREGLDTVIVGRPNVGKSSLFNALLKEDRVITSPFPGTTRDFIQETVNIGGLPVILTDTAGLGEKSSGPLGQEAEARARKRLEQADLALFLVDMSEGLTEEDEEIVGLVKGKKAILVLNKCDLVPGPDKKMAAPPSDELPCAMVSALTGQGLEELKKLIKAEAALAVSEDESGPVITTMRHKEALSRSYRHLSQARRGLKKGRPLELVSVDVKAALSALGEVVGEVTSEQVLDTIFSRFCIGK